MRRIGVSTVMCVPEVAWARSEARATRAKPAAVAAILSTSRRVLSIARPLNDANDTLRFDQRSTSHGRLEGLEACFGGAPELPAERRACRRRRDRRIDLRRGRADRPACP